MDYIPQSSRQDMGTPCLPGMSAASEIWEAIHSHYATELASDELNTPQQLPEIHTATTSEVRVATSVLPGLSDAPYSPEGSTALRAPAQTPASSVVGTPCKKRKRPSARTVPRQDSPNAIHPLNFTTFREDQDWDWDNMPDILYQLRPNEKRDRKAEANLMTYPIHGKFLRDLPVLPDNIASTVEEFRVEAWMRMDRRVRLKDITDRMHPMFRVKDNALQQRSVRFRQIFGLLAWDSGNKRSQELEYSLLLKMREKGIDPALNSTRGITPGVINPALGEAGGRIPLPKSSSQAKQGVNKWTKKQKTGSSPLANSHMLEADKPTEVPTLPQQPAVSESPAPRSNAPQARLESLDFIWSSVPFDLCEGRHDEAQRMSVSPIKIKQRPFPINWTTSAPGSAIPVLKLDLNKALAYDLRSPSLMLYGGDPRSPFPDTVFPEHCRSTVFRSMVEQCFNHQRYIFELPYFHDVIEGNDKAGI